jgi:cysteine-rich secretory family protein/IPT/TIG domain-containing protein
MKMGKLARAAWAAAACLMACGGARAPADTLPGATDRVLTLVNQARGQAGLAPLTLDPQLTQSAQSFSEYMASANFYAHAGPDGSTPLSRMNAAGFPGMGTWGENIAADYSDADSVMQVWMASPGHRANILNPTFTHIGIGVAYNANSQWKYYWTQDFGIRAGGNAPGGSASGSPIGSLPQPQIQPQAQQPVLSQLSPAQGAVGDKVTLMGRNFGNAGGSVSFGGTTATVLNWSDTRIQTQVPAGATSGAVYVQNPAGTSNGANFTVVTRTPAPQPQGTTPQALLVYPGAGNPGSRVTIYGQGFGVSAGEVLFNGVPGRVAYWYDTLIGVEIPAGATSGPVVVRASGGNSNPLSFVVESGDPAATQPRLSYCSPPAGAIGTQISVLGQNLGNTPGTASFNGVAASVVNWTSSAVVIIVPEGATSGAVTVQTGSGTSNGVPFTVIPQGQPQTLPPAPTPPPAPRAEPPGGTSLLVRRRWWGSNAGTLPTGSTSTQPSGEPQPAPAPPPAPTAGTPSAGNGGPGTGVGQEVATLTPSDGGPAAATMAPANASPGTSITIQGSNFGPTPGSVRIGRSFATVLSWTDTTVVVQVPANLGIVGRVSVRVIRRDLQYTEPLYLEMSP